MTRDMPSPEERADAAAIKAVREKLDSARASLTATRTQIDATLESVAGLVKRKNEQTEKVRDLQAWLDTNAPGWSV